MDKQNLVIFKQDSLYEIFSELEENLNFSIYQNNIYCSPSAYFYVVGLGAFCCRFKV